MAVEKVKARVMSAGRARALLQMLGPWVLGLLLVVGLHRRKLTGGAEFAGVVVADDSAFELPVKRATGIALLLHGCGAHSAKAFWPSSILCRDCVGLPAERALVAAARRRGLVALAVTSSDRRTGCWHAEGPSSQTDVDNIVTAVARVTAYLKSFPGGKAAARNIVVVGISSGGRFASILPADPRLKDKISGIVLQVSDLSVNWRNGLTNGSIKFPPVAFVAMSRDTAMTEHIVKNRKELEKAKIPTTVFIAKPKAITPAYCRSQFCEPHASQCKAIVRELRKFRHLDKRGRLVMDPRRSTWRNALADIAESVGDLLVTDKSPLAEFMNTAFARHEATGEFALKSFKWIANKHENNRGRIRGDLTTL